ncbi:MAG: FixH family protein [Deferribacteraceae bacterium]|jgi:hypothetical protein|nr:FixH family protein [Deferribacteraceae bacterium]
MKRLLLAVFLFTMAAVAAFAQTSVIELGRKIKIDDNYSYIFEFAERAKLGPATLRVELLDKDGKKTNDLSITVYSYMPSMKGHHDENRIFSVNKSNQNYLALINFVMRGQYRLEINFFKEGKLYHTGIYDIKI